MPATCPLTHVCNPCNTYPYTTLAWCVNADLSKVAITDNPMDRHSSHVMNDIHIPSPCQLNNTQCNFQRVSKPRVTPDSYRSTLSLRDNHVRVFSSRVFPDSYHSTLSLRNILTVCFHLGQHNSSAYTSSLLHLHRNFGYLHGSLTPTQKFRITPRVSYTLTEISD